MTEMEMEPRKTFNITLPEKLLKKLKILAIVDNVSLNTLIQQALEEKVQREKDKLPPIL